MTFVARSNRVLNVKVSKAFSSGIKRRSDANPHSSMGFRVDADLTPIVPLEKGRHLKLVRLDRNVLPCSVENLLRLLMPVVEVRIVHLMSFVEVNLQFHFQRLHCNFATFGIRLFSHCAVRCAMLVKNYV